MEIRETGRNNRKPEHRAPGGHYPFVRLVHATGAVYDEAKSFIDSVETRLEAARLESEHRREWLRNRGNPEQSSVVKTIDDFRKDTRYGGDGNRVDLAYAVYALSHGRSEDDVRKAIASRDLKKKGVGKRQAEYVERTVKKALQTIKGAEIGR